MNAPESSSTPPALRTGFTTGACAAAAAKAAVRVLFTGRAVSSIELALAKGRFVFPVECRLLPEGGALCGVVKDAGDDPDVTNGLEIRAQATRTAQAGVVVRGGEGVGVVTLPGLAVPPDEAAINPGPLRMIRIAVTEEMDALRDGGALTGDEGVMLTISVPDGAKIASQTMNPRLGIRGGISILGTDGIVRPYSAPAWRASVHFACKVAAEAGRKRIVFATGRRSEAFAARYLELPDEIGLVNVGDDIGYALERAQRLGFQEVIVAGMIGKISKLAQGRLTTHIDEGGVDFDFLAGLVLDLGFAGDLRLVKQARTAHAVQAQLKRAGVGGLEARLARLAARHLAGDGVLRGRVLVFSLGGDLLADEDSEGADA